jgi:hypothetical protein
MKRYLAKAGAVAAALIILMTAVQPVSAQTPQGSSGLSVNPRKNYIVKPGETINDKLNIGNLSSRTPLYVTVKLVDFTFTDQSGTPKLNLKPNAEPTPWSLKPFVKLPETVKVDPGKSVSLDMKISVPQGQGAGSYYSAIQYSSSSAEGGNVNLSASGVTLAFLSVPGAVKEDMKLQKLGAWQPDQPQSDNGKFLKIAIDQSPAIIGFVLKNEGNVAESPAGSLTMKDMFGNKVADIDKINPNSSLALIGQARRFEACLKPAAKKVDLDGKASEVISCDKTNLKPGRYTVSVQAFYGQNGNQTHEIDATASFWYLPYWFLAVVAVIVIFVAYVIWRIKRKLSKSSSDKKKSRLWRRS